MPRGSIATGEADLVIAGGVEQMSRAPLVMGKPTEAFRRGNQTLYDTTLGWRFVNPKMEAMHGTLAMGETAEKVAERCNVSREAQDRFALTSQQRAGKAIASGRIAHELTPIIDRHRQEDRRARSRSPPTSIRAPTRRPSSSRSSSPRSSQGVDGTVTAGNAIGPQRRRGGDAARERAGDQGARPHAEGPLRHRRRRPASSRATWASGRSRRRKKALARAGLTPQRIDLAELNEAFAAQAIPCIEQLGLDPERVNVNGGAIAWGHPLGASARGSCSRSMIELQQRSGALRRWRRCASASVRGSR